MEYCFHRLQHEQIICFISTWSYLDIVFCGDLIEMFGGNWSFASRLSNSITLIWRQALPTRNLQEVRVSTWSMRGTSNEATLNSLASYLMSQEHLQTEIIIALSYYYTTKRSELLSLIRITHSRAHLSSVLRNSRWETNPKSGRTSTHKTNTPIFRRRDQTLRALNSGLAY